MIVRAGMKTGINLRMENPKEMGTDRIVNLVAAYEIYGGPAIVVIISPVSSEVRPLCVESRQLALSIFPSNTPNTIFVLLTSITSIIASWVH